MALSRSQIIAADDLPFDDVPVPEWGGDVRLRMLDGEQRETVEVRLHKCKAGNATEAMQSWKGLKLLMLSYAIVDDDMTPQFSQKDVAELAKKNGAVIDRLYEHIIKQNAFSKEEAEELAGN